MISEQPQSGAPHEQVEAQVFDLRRSILPYILLMYLLSGLFWFFYIGIFRTNLAVGFSILAISILLTYAAYWLRAKSYLLASGVVLAGLVITILIVSHSHPSSLATSFYVLPILAANALLGPFPSLGLTALTVGAIVAVWNRVGYGEPELLVQGAMLCLLTWGLSWLAMRPLHESAAFALHGWSEAREALNEVRARRGELYRALRALEEATYRIERANNELIVAQHEAEQARAYKEQLAATVSHELRGPLNLILGFSGLMVLSPETYGAPLPASYREDLYTIYRNTQHLVALVDDVLDLSKIDAQRFSLILDQTDLTEDVIVGAVEMVRPLVERKGLYLRERLDDALPQVLGDSIRLRQVLLNLLINASRFTVSGGITVTAQHQGGEVIIRVEDTGPGIAEAARSQLFREFSQLRVADPREPKSSGLGLAISKHLVELHGGRIWAESEEGRGTSFAFALPVGGPDAAAIAPVKVSPIERVSNAPESCLVVHDDPTIVRTIARYLESYRVIGLPSEADLADAVETLHPRAILASSEHVAAIEKMLSGRSFDVPVVSCALPRSSEGMGEAGIHSYLIKPISSEALLALMRTVERQDETTVLLVDDDPDAVRLLERTLLSVPRPYRILKAYDGAQALERMQAVVPDILLIDLVMPGMGGLETIRRMKADERLRDVQAIVISARDQVDDKLTLGTPIQARLQRRLSLGVGVACLKALLDGLTPNYVMRG